MRKYVNPHTGRAFSDRTWIIPFFTSLLIFLTLLLTGMLGVFTTPEISPFEPVSLSDPELIEPIGDGRSRAPRLAYLISGTKGDSQRMMRTLRAVYHPRNEYVLHLDLEAPPRERLDLAGSVRSEGVVNVRVMAQSNLVTYKGPTMIACTLQAIAILLKDSSDWDWFINLSASDYPLVTQDGQ